MRFFSPNIDVDSDDQLLYGKVSLVALMVLCVLWRLNAFRNIPNCLHTLATNLCEEDDPFVDVEMAELSRNMRVNLSRQGFIND